MPTAICKTCGRPTRWNNGKGTKLRDLRCRCGGALQAARYHEGAVEPMFKGERLRYCAVCRRRRFKLMPSEAGVFQVIGPWPEYERALVRLAQGDERCSHHVQGTPVFIGDQARFQAVLSSAEILPSYVKIATQNYPDKA